MNRERVFRVLLHLQEEESSFLVAQLCIDQIAEMPTTIADMLEMSGSSEEMAANYAHCLLQAREIWELSDELLPMLQGLADEARGFWLCCPLDHMKSEQQSRAALWNIYVGGVTPLDGTTTAMVQAFRERCREVLRSRLFADLQQQYEEELAAETASVASLEARPLQLLNAFPIAYADTLKRCTPGKMHVGAAFPTTHYNYVDPSFVKMVGITIARALAVPIAGITVNAVDLDSYVTKLNNTDTSAASKTVLSYRTVRRKVTVVHWEVCMLEGVPQVINGAFAATGVDITSQIESNRIKQAGNMQKILRQWLHSIRNASFEQQAVMLLDEIQDLQMASCDPRYDEQFSSIVDGLKTLIHTAKISIGLINQALDTKGLVQLVSATDFLNNLSGFPGNFAKSEGLEKMPVKCMFRMNGVRVVPADLTKVFIKCDMINIQAFVDNIISNAVRYTDPAAGIELTVDMDRTDVTIRFRITVVDHCPGGLPDMAFDYFKRRIGVLKCVDHRSSTFNRRKKVTDGGSGSNLSTPNWSDLSASNMDEGSVSVMDCSASHPNLLALAYKRGVSIESRHSASSAGATPPLQERNKLAKMADVARKLKQCDLGVKSLSTSDRPPIPPPLSGAVNQAGRDSFDDDSTPASSPVIKPRSLLDYSKHAMHSMESHASPSTTGSSQVTKCGEDPCLASGKGRSSGTGLPHLIDLYQQLTLHGEDFDFSLSTSNSGTTISMMFIGYVNSVEETTTSTRSISSDLKLSGTLLVVDDSAVIRKIICKYLDALSVEYVVCKDGREAAEWFEQNFETCCGIITDLEMPRMGGDALIAHAKSVCAEVPCFIVSGISLANLPPGTRRAVLKPLAIEQVVSMMEEIREYQQERKQKQSSSK